MKKIITNKINPPIPTRIYDWEAYREGLDEGDPIGRGETMDEAIEDLKIQEDELNPTN